MTVPIMSDIARLALAPFLRREGVPIDVVYAEVRVPARGDRPAGRGTAELDADGWLDEDGPDPCVKTMRVSFAPGAPPCEVTVGTSDDAGDYFLLAGDRTIYLGLRRSPSRRRGRLVEAVPLR